MLLLLCYIRQLSHEVRADGFRLSFQVGITILSGVPLYFFQHEVNKFSDFEFLCFLNFFNKKKKKKKKNVDNVKSITQYYCSLTNVQIRRNNPSYPQSKY